MEKNNKNQPIMGCFWSTNVKDENHCKTGHLRAYDHNNRPIEKTKEHIYKNDHG